MKTKEAIRTEFINKVKDALQGQNTEQFCDAITQMSTDYKELFENDIKVFNASADQDILAKRGVRVLTSAETKYYNNLIDTMKTDPRMALDTSKIPLPETVLASVEEDLIKEFPLLDAVDFQTTSAVTKMVYNAQGTQNATWGAINSAIATELAGSLKEIDTQACKLSAYILVSQDMLVAGPQWIDAYVRAILTEAFGLGFCQAIVAGTGKDQPIGMIKDLAGAVTAGVYPDKTATAVTKLDVATFGKIAASLASAENGRTRTVNEILLVVNPIDYFEKVMPATTYLTNVGNYVSNVFPFPVTLVTDINVPKGKAIFGIGKLYKLFACVGGKNGEITYDDSYKFLEDYRTYKVKALANGRPVDNTAFYVADISGLKALQ